MSDDGQPSGDHARDATAFWRRVAFTAPTNVFHFRKRSVGSVHADRRCQRLLALSHGLSGPWRCSSIAAASHTVAFDASSTIYMTCRCSALTRRRGNAC